MARKRVERNIAFDDVKQRYYVNLDYGKDQTGKRVKKTKTFATLKEARECLKVFEADKIKSLMVFPIQEDFKTYATYWLKHKSMHCEKTTIYGYKNMLHNHIIPYLGHILLQKIIAKDLRNYFIHLNEDKKLSNNTIRKHYDLLRIIFIEAKYEEKILKNPMLNVKGIKVEDPETDVYTTEQLRKLFKKIEEHPLELPVKLAGYLGLRRGEINGLKWCLC